MSDEGVSSEDYPGWMRDGGSRPLRAQILTRRAARRSMGRTSVKDKNQPPEIPRGNCGRCSGWGVLRPSGERCPMCKGSGVARTSAPRPPVAS